MMLNNKEDSNKALHIIGITGEAGSGKTTITKAYAKLKKGYCIFTDDIAKDIMKQNTNCFNKIINYFGKGILDSEGEINRNKLANIVFNSRKELDVLNSFVHREVVIEVKEIIKKLKCLNNDSKCGNIYEVVLIESAILFQVDELVKLCDEIWYIQSDEDERRRRLKRERNYSNERIEAMSISQESIRLAREKCDKVIINDRDMEELNNYLLTM